MKRTIKALQEMSKEDLVNYVYNNQAQELADNNGEKKGIPYMGLFWRATDFVGKCIPIGKTNNGYVGIMENNKWDYPERDMTEQEVDTLTGYLDRVFESNDEEEIEAIRKECYKWFQSLTIQG